MYQTHSRPIILFYTFTIIILVGFIAFHYFSYSPNRTDNASTQNERQVENILNNQEFSYQELVMKVKKSLLEQNYQEAAQYQLFVIEHCSVDKEFDEIGEVFILTYIYLMLDKKDKAIEVCEKIIARNPDAKILVALTCVYLRSNEEDKALSLLDRIEHGFFPGFVNSEIFVSYTRMIIYFLHAKIDEGVLEYEKLQNHVKIAEQNKDFEFSKEHLASLEIFMQYMTNPSSEYSIQYSKEPPDPPELINKHPLKISCEIFVSFKIVNKKGDIVYVTKL